MFKTLVLSGFPLGGGALSFNFRGLETKREVEEIEKISRHQDDVTGHCVLVTQSNFKGIGKTRLLRKQRLLVMTETSKCNCTEDIKSSLRKGRRTE